ncbi:MAG: hypothetical protein QM796_12390 [Chthoniobacteraceae bacterium]
MINPSDLELDLPVVQIPPIPPKPPLSFDDYLAWLEEGRRDIIANGLLERLRNDPCRCPVNAQFRLID